MIARLIKKVKEIALIKRKEIGSLGTFIIKNVFLGIGLAMDAFSASVANGLKNRKSSLTNTMKISGTFSFFQMIMPLIGWVFVKRALDTFAVIERAIPFISLMLLTFIGSKMIYENIFGSHSDECDAILKGRLLFQGVATSLDALSVGFTISEYNFETAFISALIIGAITFFICALGVFIGNYAVKYSYEKAEIFGGIILIIVGIEIFVTSL